MKKFDEATLIFLFKSFNMIRRKRLKFNSKEDFKTYVKLENQMTLIYVALVVIAFGLMYIIHDVTRPFFTVGVVNIFSLFTLVIALFLVPFLNRKAFVYLNRDKEFKKEFVETIENQM